MTLNILSRPWPSRRSCVMWTNYMPWDQEMCWWATFRGTGSDFSRNLAIFFTPEGRCWQNFLTMHCINGLLFGRLFVENKYCCLVCQNNLALMIDSLRLYSLMNLRLEMLPVHWSWPTHQRTIGAEWAADIRLAVCRQRHNIVTSPHWFHQWCRMAVVDWLLGRVMHM